MLNGGPGAGMFAARQNATLAVARRQTQAHRHEGQGNKNEYRSYMKKHAAFCVSMIVAISAVSAAQAPKKAASAPAGPVHHLAATPQTVVWGYYDAAAPPALRIKSGEAVEFDTLLTNSPQRLEQAGVAAAEVQQSLRDIYDKVTNKGPGGHILTGPVYVEGAEPGDVLEVRIEQIKLAIPYAYNGFGVGRGFLPEDFDHSKTKIIRLNEKRGLAEFGPGIEVPMRPFFGSMGVAPPPERGRLNSAPPDIQGGNMDNKDLVAGTTVYLPVWAPGGLFVVGDGHAAQGNGEVDITAIETSLVGRLRFIVRKDLHYKYPRAETPTHYISMGFNEDLTLATKKAVHEMIDFLVSEKGMTRDDAYMLTSVAGDVDITELVDGNKGVHVLMPKRVFVGK
jgi:acetamidase/formamidase